MDREWKRVLIVGLMVLNDTVLKTYPLKSGETFLDEALPLCPSRQAHYKQQGIVYGLRHLLGVAYYNKPRRLRRYEIW